MLDLNYVLYRVLSFVWYVAFIFALAYLVYLIYLYLKEKISK